MNNKDFCFQPTVRFIVLPGRDLSFLWLDQYVTFRSIIPDWISTGVNSYLLCHLIDKDFVDVGYKKENNICKHVSDSL